MKERSLQEYRDLLYAAVNVDEDALRRAQNYLKEWIHAGGEEIDFEDPELMAAFDLLQMIHKRNAIQKQK